MLLRLLLLLLTATGGAHSQQQDLDGKLTQCSSNSGEKPTFTCDEYNGLFADYGAKLVSNA